MFTNGCSSRTLLILCRDPSLETDQIPETMGGLVEKHKGNGESSLQVVQAIPFERVSAWPLLPLSWPRFHSSGTRSRLCDRAVDFPSIAGGCGKPYRNLYCAGTPRCCWGHSTYFGGHPPLNGWVFDSTLMGARVL